MKATVPLFSLYFLFAVVFTAETRRQLTESYRIDTNNNAFGDFALGRGFDSSQGEMKEAHAFREGEVTYDYMPITRTRTKCVTIQSAKDAAEKLEIYGQMAVTYNAISADGFLEFNRGEEQMERNAFFKCLIDRTLFTASINTDEIYPSEEDLANGGSSSHLLNPTVDVLTTAEEKRALIGDKYVSSITYGRRYEVEIQVSYSKQNSWDQLSGGVKAEIGIGVLKVSAEIKLNMESSKTSEDLKMTVTSTSTGFVEKTPMMFPVAAKCRTAEDSGLEIDVDVDVGRRLLMQGRRSLKDCPTDEQISVGEQMQAMLQENIDAMNAMDLENNLTNVAESGLSKEKLFAKIGTAYPLSYTTGTNSMWYPIMAENAFTQEITRNIKQAWMIFTELQQFIDEFDRMSETLYDNYHLLSGATTLSDTFMNYRQALTEEIMVLQNEVREYTNLHPNTIKEGTIFFWAMNMRNDPDQEDKMLDHLTMDHIHQKVYRLMGMEDSLMEDTNPIGDTCVFHGITADIDGVRVRFAGDVVFGEHKVKHVLFDEEGETVSLGYIDRKDGTAQELVYVKKDCSLFRVGTTVWFKGGRYEIVQIGSEEHMDGLKVVKEMLTNIRIEIKPVSTTTEALAIMVTAGGLNYLTLRGDDDHQAVFRVDDNGLLMYLNGYVCGTNFGEYEAKMVCSNLGFSGLNTFETSQQLPANSAWQLALTTMTDLECPMYSTKPEDCTFFVEGDDGFGVCDLQSGVHIQCTNNVIVESVHFSAGTEEGCVSYSHERQSVSRACNGGSSDIINVDEVHVTGNLCASMFTTDTEGPFCTVPTGSSTIDNHCSHVATGGAISMAEFEIIEPNSITMEGYIVNSSTFQHDVTVTLEVGDYTNSEVKNLNLGFQYPPFDCSYKGRTFTVTASLEDHSCTVSRASGYDLVGVPISDATANTWDEALTDILREDTLFVVTCIAFPTAAPTVAPPSAAPTVAPTLAPTMSPVPTFAPSARPRTCFGEDEECTRIFDQDECEQFGASYSWWWDTYSGGLCYWDPNAGETQEPTEATMEPTDATMEPSEVTMEPTEATMEPSEATMEPSEVTMEPSEATMEPTDVTAEPTARTLDNVGSGYCGSFVELSAQASVAECYDAAAADSQCDSGQGLVISYGSGSRAERCLCSCTGSACTVHTSYSSSGESVPGTSCSLTGQLLGPNGYESYVIGEPREVTNCGGYLSYSELPSDWCNSISDWAICGIADGVIDGSGYGCEFDAGRTGSCHDMSNECAAFAK